MTVIVTPPGGAPMALVPTSEPTYTLTEQGGFADCTIPALVPSDLVPNLRLGEMLIDGTRWFGHVRTATTTGITGQGAQSRFDDFPRGRVYVTHDLSAWVESRNPGKSKHASIDVTDTDEFVFTFSKPWEGYTGIGYYLPEPQAITLRFSHTAFAANYTMEVRADGVAVASYQYSGGVSASDRDVDLGVCSSFSVYVTRVAIDSPYPAWEGDHAYSAGDKRHVTHDGCDRNYKCTDPHTSSSSFSSDVENWRDISSTGDYTITLSDIVATHTPSQTLPAIIEDIMQPALDAGYIVGVDIDQTLTHNFSELVFDAGSKLLDKLAYILPHGDWRAYVEARQDGPWFVFAARSTATAYHLTEGSGPGWRVSVEADPQSCDPLCSIVRARYASTSGREYFHDEPDTDRTHYLVAKGITKYAVIDTGQTTAAAAEAVAKRYQLDAGRDQYQATVSIEGAPNGIPACDHLPGGIMEVSTDEGTRTARITAGTYTGEYLAVLTLDNAPDLAALIGRLSQQNFNRRPNPRNDPRIKQHLH